MARRPSNIQNIPILLLQKAKPLKRDGSSVLFYLSHPLYENYILFVTTACMCFLRPRRYIHLNSLKNTYNRFFAFLIGNKINRKFYRFSVHFFLSFSFLYFFYFLALTIFYLLDINADFFTLNITYFRRFIDFIFALIRLIIFYFMIKLIIKINPF